MVLCQEFSGKALFFEFVTDQIFKNEGIKMDRIELTASSQGDWKIKAA
jgi:hypothetical protein